MSLHRFTTIAWASAALAMGFAGALAGCAAPACDFALCDHGWLRVCVASDEGKWEIRSVDCSREGLVCSQEAQACVADAAPNGNEAAGGGDGK
jgi:hypothetical protein